MGSCDRCAGAGTVAAAELGANPGSAPYTCPSCGGSGVNETHARRPMPWRPGSGTAGIDAVGRWSGQTRRARSPGVVNARCRKSASQQSSPGTRDRRRLTDAGMDPNHDRPGDSRGGHRPGI